VRIKLALLALMLLAARPAHALLCGTILDPMSVSADPLNFGNYIPTDAGFANTHVKVSCGLLGLDLLPNFTVALSAGNAATPLGRYLAMSGARLEYNIYADPGFATIWGDGSSGSVTQTFNGVLTLGNNITFTGYGRIPAGQYVAAGIYRDTITVTVSY
jgi:spore coat protein U-like protein